MGPEPSEIVYSQALLSKWATAEATEAAPVQPAQTHAHTQCVCVQQQRGTTNLDRRATPCFCTVYHWSRGAVFWKLQKEQQHFGGRQPSPHIKSRLEKDASTL